MKRYEIPTKLLAHLTQAGWKDILVALSIFGRLVNSCRKQQLRILQSKTEIEFYIKTRDFDAMKQAAAQLFNDIHFYLVGWGNISKMLNFIDRKINTPGFSRIIRSYSEEFKKYKEFRNHLEHLDERIGKHDDLGDLENNTFTFAGKGIDISPLSFKLLDRLFDEVMEYLVSL